MIISNKEDLEQYLSNKAENLEFYEEDGRRAFEVRAESGEKLANYFMSFLVRRENYLRGKKAPYKYAIPIIVGEFLTSGQLDLLLDRCNLLLEDQIKKQLQKG